MELRFRNLWSGFRLTVSFRLFWVRATSQTGKKILLLWHWNVTAADYPWECPGDQFSAMVLSQCPWRCRDKDNAFEQLSTSLVSLWTLLEQESFARRRRVLKQEGAAIFGFHGTRLQKYTDIYLASSGTQSFKQSLIERRSTNQPLLLYTTLCLLGKGETKEKVYCAWVIAHVLRAKCTVICFGQNVKSKVPIFGVLSSRVAGSGLRPTQPSEHTVLQYEYSTAFVSHALESMWKKSSRVLVITWDSHHDEK